MTRAAPHRGWFKSSRSNGANNNCVEVRFDDWAVLVRDSKHPDGAVLRFDRSEWTAFLRGMAGGEFG